MRNRLIIIIVPVLLLVLGVGGVIFLRNRNSAPTAMTAPPLAPVATTTPLRLLADEQVISVEPSFNGEAVWFMTAAGALTRLELATKKTQPFNFPEPVKNPLALMWQEKGSDLLVQDNLNGHVRTRHYDATGKKFTAYPDQIRNPVFLAGNTQIAYDWVSVPKGAKAPKHELKVSNLDGSNFRKIGDLFRPDYILVPSPVAQSVALYAPTASEGAQLVLVDLVSGKFQTIDEKAVYTGIKFSPNGMKILVSVSGPGGTESLRVYNLEDLSKTDLAIPTKFSATIWTPDSGSIVYLNSDGVSQVALQNQNIKLNYAFQPSEKVVVRQLFWQPPAAALFIVDDLSGKLYLLDYSR